MINPNEAPDGYVAKPAKHACNGCAFWVGDDCTLTDFSCYPSERGDGECVIFVPREKSNIAKAGDIIMIGIEVPEEYDGVHIDLIFEDFVNEPHGWSKTLEGIKGKEEK